MKLSDTSASWDVRSWQDDSKAPDQSPETKQVQSDTTTGNTPDASRQHPELVRATIAEMHIYVDVVVLCGVRAPAARGAGGAIVSIFHIDHHVLTELEDSLLRAARVLGPGNAWAKAGSSLAHDHRVWCSRSPRGR